MSLFYLKFFNEFPLHLKRMPILKNGLQGHTWSGLLSGRLIVPNSFNLLCPFLYNLTCSFLLSRSGISFSILWNWVWLRTCFGQVKHYQMWYKHRLESVYWGLFSAATLKPPVGFAFQLMTTLSLHLFRLKSLYPMERNWADSQYQLPDM